MSSKQSSEGPNGINYTIICLINTIIIIGNHSTRNKMPNGGRNSDMDFKVMSK